MLILCFRLSRFGYFRASWTLRADMIGEFVCRLLNHMKANGFKKVVPTLRPEDKDMKILPWIDQDNFNPLYLNRAMHLLPKRGDKNEWAHTQDYWWVFRHPSSTKDGLLTHLRFDRREKDEFPLIDLQGAEFVYA